MKTYNIKAVSLALAIDYMREHAQRVDTLYLTEYAKQIRAVINDIETQITLQQPQTVDEQIAVLTDVMSCGPETDFNKA